MSRKRRNKYYVVWEGKTPGIYDNWEKCKEQIHGYPEAKYKSFPDREMAEEAYNCSPEEVVGIDVFSNYMDKELIKKVGMPVKESISVDAACSSNNQVMEYRGVETNTGKEIFRRGPYEGGSNNIGEFLAIVHALAYCKQNNIGLPIYSDSKIAMSWVRLKKAKTNVEQEDRNQNLFELIARAEKWLKENRWGNEILKWETAAWGEIPADFGRK